MTKLNDPAFGELEFDGYTWRGTTGLTLNGERVGVAVDATLETGPSDSQRAAFQGFLRMHEDLLAPLERMVFLEYTETMPIYRDAMGDLADELMPVLERPSQVWPMLTLPSVYVPVQADGPEFEYHFETGWDVEHGLKVIVRDGPTFAVSTQTGPSWEHLPHYDANGQPVTAP